jgi:hypothetical protein
VATDQQALTAPVDAPAGPAAAAILAAGVGAFTLGLLTTLAEASTSVSDFLNFADDVGPLSGKTILAAAAYLASWLVLWLVLRHRNPSLRTTLWIAGILVGLGVLGTFPTFFQAFADD